MSTYGATRRDIDRRSGEIQQALFNYIAEEGRLAVVKAPPGSGKTRLLIDSAVHVRRKRVAIACQTNSQADDTCERFARDHTGVQVVRFASGVAKPREFGPNVSWETETTSLPHGACIVIATTAKWGLVNLDYPFDILFVDEAWQMAWKDFMLLGQVAGRFVLIGDPGQIPPIVTIEAKRWETSPRPPHRPTPEVILDDPSLGTLLLELPATRRLPHDSARLVQPFYDFPFNSYAGPGERALHVSKSGDSGIHRAVLALQESTVVGLTIPTPDGGPPLEKDDALADAAVRVIAHLLKNEASWRDEGTVSRLEPGQIGISATHRVMNSAIDLALPSRLRGAIRVDTPERWQGLECPVMLVIHPLSGMLSPGDFNLETGRMCVMLSRHRSALIVLSRDHVGETLDNYVPSATQAVGRPDVTGRGHEVHRGLWDTLSREGHLYRA